MYLLQSSTTEFSIIHENKYRVIYVSETVK